MVVMGTVSAVGSQQDRSLARVCPHLCSPLTLSPASFLHPPITGHTQQSSSESCGTNWPFMFIRTPRDLLAWYQEERTEGLWGFHQLVRANAVIKMYCMNYNSSPLLSSTETNSPATSESFLPAKENAFRVFSLASATVAMH